MSYLKHTLLVIALASTSWLLSGCSATSDSNPASAESGPRTSALLDTVDVDVDAIDLDDLNLSGVTLELVRLTRLIPGFGGMFLDEEGVLNVYIQEPLLEQTTVEAILPALRTAEGYSSDVYREGNVILLPGRYTFDDLVRWEYAIKDVMSIDGVLSLGPDEGLNRVKLGVRDLSVEDEVRAYIRAVGVSNEAVHVYKDTPVSFRSDVDDRVRPMRGGLEIGVNRSDGSEGRCTMTVVSNYYDSGYKYSFITNSHCTDIQGGTEGTTFTQDFSSSTVIAQELYDPPCFTGGNCPQGRQCRYSDAAYASFDGYNQNNNIDVNTIVDAEDSFGSRQITGTFDVDDREYAMMGEVVNKVGAATGWTDGTVFETGMRFNGTIDGSDTGITLLDQSRAFTTGDDGDSGAPVYQKQNNGFVGLNGVMWGAGVTDNSEQFIAFGTQDRIIQELPSGGDVQDD